MQAYGPSFAKIYNLRWGAFARQAGPRLREYYESRPAVQESKRVLDLCCGTGLVALHFLENGYQAACLDLSSDMLSYARQNCAEYIPSGRVQFYQADASHFVLEDPAGLVVSTFDALNHLENLPALQSCFASVYRALSPGGVFIFDLNTRAGLRRWNSISVEDGDELALITRGVYDGTAARAISNISGFLKVQGGLYERFEETVFNTVFEMQKVQESLYQAGFQEVHPARLQDLSAPLENPEGEVRVFFVARK